MQVDAYLKLKDINGECSDFKYCKKGVIQLEWCRVGDATRETPWSKAYRACERILNEEEKGGKKLSAAEAKLAKLENRTERVPMDDMLEKLSAINHEYGLQHFEKAIDLLKTSRDNLASVGASMASDLRPFFNQLIKVATEEEKEAEAVRKAGATEVEAKEEEKKACALHIRKMADRSSPGLYLRYCRFKTLADDASTQFVIIESAKLWTRKAGDPLVYKEWEFRTLTVTGFDWATRQDGTVEENVSFAANSVRMTYRPQDRTGKEIVGKALTAEWDFQANTKEGVAPLDDDEILGG